MSFLMLMEEHYKICENVHALSSFVRCKGTEQTDAPSERQSVF